MIREEEAYGFGFELIIRGTQSAEPTTGSGVSRVIFGWPERRRRRRSESERRWKNYIHCFAALSPGWQWLHHSRDNNQLLCTSTIFLNRKSSNRKR